MPRLPAFLDEHPEIELDIITTNWVTPPLEASTPLHIDFGPLPDTAELVVGPQHCSRSLTPTSPPVSMSPLI